MSIRIGDVAPDFNAKTTQGDIHFYHWLDDQWAVLFSHPKDFTPVCTTELGRVAKLKSSFDAKGVKVIGLSVDSLESHIEWIKDINETQNTTLNFPLIADSDGGIATRYDMLDPSSDNTMTARNVFVIAPDKTIKLMITYPASTGRNFDEILRAIDSLQLTVNHEVATPVDWKYGEDCIVIPSVHDDQIPRKFPKGHKRIKSYYRTTPQPNL